MYLKYCTILVIYVTLPARHHYQSLKYVNNTLEIHSHAAQIKLNSHQRTEEAILNHVYFIY